MKGLSNTTRRVFLYCMILAGAAFSTGCEPNTNDPLPTGKTLTVGGKINSASQDGAILTFSPASEFYTARFYAGNVPFNDLKGAKWQTRSIASILTDNIAFNDGKNDWKSPLNLVNASGLNSGETYTMLIFYTNDESDENQQGSIVFVR